MSSDLHEQTDRARSFGSVAEVYDRIRPTYPDELVRDLLAGLPAGPSSEVLDVGCGTGRAGLLFAAQGCRVLGVEPDPAMAAVARRHGLEVEEGTFEQWDDRGRRFELLVSGQAWHWVEPAAGAARAAQVVRPGGRVGLFWNMDSMSPHDRGVLDDAYEPIAPHLKNRSRNYGGKRAPRTPVLEALSDTGFADVAEADYTWQRHYTPDEFVQLIGTFSDHNLLPAEQRTRLYESVGAAVAGLGGLDVSYECHLITATAPGDGTDGG